MLKDAKNYNLIKINPADGVKAIDYTPTKRMAFTVEELVWLFNHPEMFYDEMFYDIVLFLALTGLRKSEILGITPESIVNGYVLNIDKQFQLETQKFSVPKMDKKRSIYMSDLAIKIISKYLKGKGPMERLFDIGNTRLSDDFKILKVAIRSSERGANEYFQDISCHYLRHSLATALSLSLDVPLQLTAYYCSWKTQVPLYSGAQEVYVTFFADSLELVAKKIDKLFSGVNYPY